MDYSKVLLIEDDANWLKIFQILIVDKTLDLFEYSYAKNLTEALEAIEKNQYELIILDLMLPDSDAINTIQVISKKVLYSPIIVMTTLEDEKLIQLTYNLGVEDYLVKDQYNIEVFIHVSQQAIKRFLGKTTNSLEITAKKIINNLKLLNTHLDQWQKKNL